MAPTFKRIHNANTRSNSNDSNTNSSNSKASNHNNHSQRLPPVLYLPSFCIDIIRLFDRAGGRDSASLKRMLRTENATEALINQQLVWNAMTPSHVVKAMAHQRLRCTSEDYAQIKTPVVLFVGEKDKLTPPEECEDIASILKDYAKGPYVLPVCGHQIMLEATHIVIALTNCLIRREINIDLRKSSIYSKTTSRSNSNDSSSSNNTLASSSHTRTSSGGLYSSMSSSNIDGDNKWGLKNFKKWSRVEPFGKIMRNLAPQAPTNVVGLLPLKMMREDDSHHSPATFSEQNPQIKLVIDLSAQMPPYLWMDQPFAYVKLKTKSKSVPHVTRCASLLTLSTHTLQRIITACSVVTMWLASIVTMALTARGLLLYHILWSVGGWMLKMRLKCFVMGVHLVFVMITFSLNSANATGGKQ